MSPKPAAPLEIRYAALCDRGLIREENQDAAFAGPRLLAVADGFGRRGAEAGRLAIDTLRELDEDAYTDAPAATATGVASGGDVLNLLQDAAARANRAVRELDADPGGSTLTAMLWTGSQLALVHIGDSRAYLLRDGEFFQITEDHTLVRSLIEEGRLTPAEALSHPQRSLLVKALGTPTNELDPQLHMTDVRAGDRYLLCTDGLSGVPAEKLHAALKSGIAEDPVVTVRRLIELSYEAGGSDNVACVVADVVPPPDQSLAA